MQKYNNSSMQPNKYKDYLPFMSFLRIFAAEKKLSRV